MKLLVVAVAGMALAACQPSGPELADVPPAETPVAPAPSPETSPPLATSAAIPAKFHGKWDESVDACDRPSIMALTISANELLFHESIGEITSVTPEGEGAIEIAGPFEGEGESWDGRLRLALSADGRTLTVTNNGTATLRVRCP